MGVRRTVIQKAVYWKVFTARTEPPTTKYFRVKRGAKAKERAHKFYDDLMKELDGSPDAVSTAGGPRSRIKEGKNKRFKTGSTNIVFRVGERKLKDGGIGLNPSFKLTYYSNGKCLKTLERSTGKYGYAEAWRLIHEEYIKYFKLDPVTDALEMPSYRKAKKYLRDVYGITTLPK